MTHGGPRPGAGRPRLPEPSTPEEAARALGRYVEGVVAAEDGVHVPTQAAAAIVRRLRKRAVVREEL